MNNQSLILCLEQIKLNVLHGNAKAALLNLDKLEVAIHACECPDLPDVSEYPAILREQAL